jgi:hypothetical protein
LDLRHTHRLSAADRSFSAAGLRAANDPTLAKWAGQYGWQPYSWNGKEVYCHDGTGSGAQCMLSKNMAVMMAENQLPILPLSTVIYPLSPSVF